MLKLPPPNPLAFTGPFPLGDLAPQSMSREQIESVVAHAPRFYNTGENLPTDGHFPTKAVARVSSHAVVKYGTGVPLGEGQTMITVQRQVQISMPKVYDCWKSPQHVDRLGNESVYIVMQYVPGKTLAQTVEHLDEDQAWDLTNQLVCILKTLHTIRHAVPGPVGGGRAMAPRVFTSSGAGPFQSITDLTDWFNGCLELCQHFGKATKQQRFDNDIEDLVMCHMDLHSHNLMVDDAGKLWLIDWDCAGFYPEFLEYICIKGNVDFMPIEMMSVADAKFLERVVDALETPEARRMNAKFDAIGYALRK